MSSPARHHLPSALRFCGSCCINIGCWALWLLLTATLILLICIATTKELTVPGFVLRRMEAKLAQANLSVQFGRTQIDPRGEILLQDVSFYVQPHQEPVLTSRLVFIRLNFWSLLGAQALPDEIQLEGATLQLPAILSPSGAVEPLVRDLALTLGIDNKHCQLQQFTGRLGELTVTANGGFDLPAAKPGTPPPDVAALIGSFLKNGRQVALAIHQLEAFDSPSLAIRLSPQTDAGNEATILFTARQINPTAALPLKAQGVAATTTFALSTAQARPLRVQIAAEQASYGNLAQVQTVRAILAAECAADHFVPQLREAWLAFGSLTADGETALGAVLRADLSQWPETVHATAALQISGEFLAAEVEAQLRAQTAQIAAAGSGDPAFINRVLGKHTPRAAPFFVFADPVVFNAAATLGPGWRFATLASRVAAGRIDSHGVKITSARGRVDIDGMDFLAHEAYVTLGENEARGSYGMNFSSADYRMLLNGRLRPPMIQGWFNGPWWTDFWNEHFAFPQSLPEADVDVQGCWREPSRTSFYGYAKAENARVWSGDLESAHARIFLRPHFTHVIDCFGTQRGGAQQLTGSLKRFGNPTTHETTRLEFDGRGNIEPETYRRMLGPISDDIIHSLAFDVAPTVQAKGYLDGTWPRLTPHFTFSGETKSPLRFHGFPLDNASAQGEFAGNRLQFNNLRFGLAGGQGQGYATLDIGTPATTLGFNVNLEQADVVQAVHALEAYQLNHDGKAPNTEAESKFMKQIAGGRLQLSLSAQGDPNDLVHLSGSGNTALTGAALGEIQLFGLLSQLLSGLSLNFSSLKLDTARSSFKLDSGHLWFPDLKITGSTAVIDAKGDLDLETKALDFTARFKPYEENRNLLTAAIGLVMNPLTSILELQLTGPISKPNWSIVVGPSSHQPTQVSPTKPSAPPAPAP